MRIPVTCLLTIMVCAPSLAAQDLTPLLSPGSRVRVWSPSAKLKRATGHVLALADDSLVLRVEHGRRKWQVDSIRYTEHRVPTSTIERIEVMTGTRPNTTRGLLGGLMVGGGLGLLMAVGGSGCDDTDWCFAPGPYEMFLFTTGLCAAVGAIVGAADSREIWQQVSLTPTTPPRAVHRGPAIRVGPAPNGAGLAIRLPL